MRFGAVIGSILLVANMMTGSASAMQLPAAPSAGKDMLVQVGGCHREPERHYVPEFGRRAWHYHRGNNCRPIEVPPPAPPPPPQYEDCHRDVQRHFVPEYGRRLTHRHVGPSCRIQVFEEVAPGRPPSGFCVTIGGASFCVNE